VYAGEASVYYTHLPLATGVAERVWRFNPNARLMYIMRDPVERTISHYWHQVAHDAEYRDIMTAIMNDRRYCDVSHYSMQLRPYYELFRVTQIKVLTLEELLTDYEVTIKSIFTWLNICDFVPLRQLTRENENISTVQQQIMLWGTIYHSSRRHYLWRASISLVPRSIRNYSRQRFARKVNRSDVDVEPVIQYLRPLQREQTKELSALTRRNFHEWMTLFP
jgi:hypothetical protein